MGGFSTFGSDVLNVISLGGLPVRRFKAAGVEWVVDDAAFVRLDGSQGVLAPDGHRPLDPAVMAITSTRYLDVSFRCFVKSAEGHGVAVRYQGSGGDLYKLDFYKLGTTSNKARIVKWVAGVWTELAGGGVPTTGYWYDLALSASGSTLKGLWSLGRSLNLVATDTDIAVEGHVGMVSPGIAGFAPVSVGPPMTPPPRIIGYYEIPVIGSGSNEDPFRAQLSVQGEGGETPLPLSHAALIKSGSDGRPKEYTAIVRVFDDPNRDPSLPPISQLLETLKTIQGVRQLTREQAIARAKAIDDKLSDLDLLSARELGQDVKAAVKLYRSWRVSSLGVKDELVDDGVTARYVFEDKGW